MPGPPRSVLFTACAAAVVTVTGLIVALSSRPSPVADEASSPDTGDALRCGSTPCQSVVSRVVGDDSVELLVGQGSGRIRVSGASGVNIFESTIAESGAEITADSLQCVDAATRVCLVRGVQAGDLLGEVLLGRADAWSRAPVPYLSSGSYLGLHDVDGDSIADVVAVQRDCGSGECRQVFAQVFSLAGANIELGCTATVGVAEELPGWPTVAPAPAQLRPCSA